MDLAAVEKSYARWAPIYDRTFGAVTNRGRRAATAILSSLGGSVLEVGVGTGLALPLYGPGVRVTGVDYSEEMLAKARARVAALGLRHVASLDRMDARALGYPDAHFDHVACMHVISVVPDPDRVMAEIARVVRPGGTVVVVNHFRRDGGVLGALERATAPLSNQLGWHSDFDRAVVLAERRLRLVEERPMPPLGMMTLLRLVREP